MPAQHYQCYHNARVYIIVTQYHFSVVLKSLHFGHVVAQSCKNMTRKTISWDFLPEKEQKQLQDLIKNCEVEPADSHNDLIRRPGNFPAPEEDEVEGMLRRNRSVRIERPKTYAPSITKKREEPLEFIGVTRLEIDQEKCVKITRAQYLRLFERQLELIGPRGHPEIIRKDVVLKKGVKIIGKKELELLDQDKTIYRLHFDTQKDAKAFIDIEKTYHAARSTTPLKNIGPWWQLKKLLKKRSSRDILESKGIIRNEPIFGNTLEELCDAQHQVPEVVTRLVQLIEEPRNIVSLGIYRASANLAVLQNIRCEINLKKWEILEQYKDDVDVLTGTLKLFFRELKQPLVGPETQRRLQKALIASSATPQEINQIIDGLPPPNRSTFRFIINHLLRVCQHREENKMDFHNMAICWGPSLIPLVDNGTDIIVQTSNLTDITERLLEHYSSGVSQYSPPVTTDFAYEAIRTLIDIIENHIAVEGIYRKSGSNPKIDKLMKSLEKQSLTEITNGKNDIHDLCCVLKKYVASIRATIVTDEFFHRYLEICDTVGDSLGDEVRRMVDELPRKNLVLLIFEHLKEVVQHEARNKMSVSVLSDIWMATLMIGYHVQNYKVNMSKCTKLFLILMNLNESNASNGAWGRKLRSKYDNVPDDIHNEGETCHDSAITKL